jgi:penicillin amidase
MRLVGEREMLALQLDDRAIFLRRWRDLLSRQLEATQEATPAQLRCIRDDSDRASVESTGYGFVRRFRLEVHERVLDAWLAPAAGMAGFDRRYLLPQIEESIWQAVQQQPLHLLPAKFESWDALLADAWNEARAVEPWGEHNRLQMHHPLSSALPWLSRWLDMPAEPVGGDSRMPRVQGPGFGPSERLVVAPGREEEAIFHMPGGISGHPLSPFYRAGHRDWVDGRPTRFVEEKTPHRLELRP